MRPITMVFVTDVDRSVAFYEQLGFELRLQSRPPGEDQPSWTELASNGTTLALHRYPPDKLPSADDNRLVLCFDTDEPLESLAARLDGEGASILSRPTDDNFGRYIEVADPDGLVIQINETRPELYT